MTLPLLISSYRKKVIAAQLKEFYSIMNQAIKLSEYDNESMDGWELPGASFDSQGHAIKGTGDYEWFQKYLQPYFKSSTLKKSYHLWCVWYDGFAIEFINGTGVSCGIYEGGFPNDFLCMFYPKAGTIKDVEDDNAKSQKLVSGKDYFVFIMDLKNNNGLQPYNSNECKQTTSTKLLPSRGCAKLIKNNGWEIPSNYPIKI